MMMQSTGRPGQAPSGGRAPLFWLGLLLGGLPASHALSAQEPRGFGEAGQVPQAEISPPDPASAAPPSAAQAEASAQERAWKEGATIRLRVPVASDARELMAAVLFPESGIRSAVSGWGEATLSAIPKGPYLFLRLSKKAEGQLSVIGDSGTHYLLYLEGVEAAGPGSYDAFVKIVRPMPAPESGDTRTGKGPVRKPKGALDLLRAMRLGAAWENTRILRARGELVLGTPEVELRLLYLYQAPSYLGRIYEVRNVSGRALALDASRFRASGDELVMSALRENVIPAGGSTRLYGIFWRLR